MNWMVLIGLFQVRSGKCFPYLLLTREKIREKCKLHRYLCTSQQKVDTTLYFYTSFNEHNTPYTVLESDNSESMPDVLH